MRVVARFLPIFAALACAALIAAAPVTVYVPQAVFCVSGGTSLCSIVPGNIGPDPALARSNGYRGIVGAHPTSAATDVETPFDNLSWQTFVALNWANGQQSQPPQQGLNAPGPRVWESWKRISQVFGNSPVQANCPVTAGEEYFSIASKGNGTPATRNEEYIQAATGEPAIDVDGNWTLYERRVNNIEIAYLQAPSGNPNWNLTNLPGQARFVAAKQVVNFPSVGTNNALNGAMEIKAAWRILDPKKHAQNAKKFYIVRAMLAVAPDLVDRGTSALVAPICAPVELGLVAMHIIQKNPDTSKTTNLKPEWFWSTFEQIDNAPLAAKPCDITNPGACGTLNQLACPAALPPGSPDYSYFNAKDQNGATNQPPVLAPGAKAYMWNPSQPFAKAYLVAAAGDPKLKVGTQISRCWQIYALTRQLNTQWQEKLRAAGSVFANYMLIGTQWGANIEPRSTPGPEDAAPNYLSNSVVETYLQTFYTPGQGFNTGSCVSCHAIATLTANANVSANFSFLPGEVNPLLERRKLMAPIPH